MDTGLDTNSDIKINPASDLDSTVVPLRKQRRGGVAGGSGDSILNQVSGSTKIRFLVSLGSTYSGSGSG